MIFGQQTKIWINSYFVQVKVRITVFTVNKGIYITFQVITYTCNSGSTITSGNAKRACLRNGQLTGTAPTCAGNKLTWIKHENTITFLTISLYYTRYMYSSVNLQVKSLSKNIQPMLCVLQCVSMLNSIS